MKISKKDLLEQLEMDEMAHKKKGVQAARTNPNSGQLKPPKNQPYFVDGNETDIPDAWIICPQQIPGTERAIILQHGPPLEQFIQENAGLLEKLNELSGGNLEIYEGNRTIWQPRSKKLGTTFVPTGNKMPMKETILRKFNPILKSVLTDKVNEHLIKCGLSPINTYDNQAAVDKYSEISNYRLDFETHDYDFYNSVFDFAKAAKELMLKGGTGVDVYRTHMPRQYNPGTNWSALRKTEKMNTNFKNDPLTPVYALAKRGYEAEDKDVALSTTLHITGRLEGANYVWSSEITTAYGKKLKEEMRVNSGVFEKDKTILADHQVTFDNSNFDPETKSIMNVAEISEGLVAMLNKLAAKVLEISPREELIKRVRVQQSDITQRPTTPPSLNESELVSLVMNTLIEMKPLPGK
jgi:hypothetical protein